MKKRTFPDSRERLIRITGFVWIAIIILSLSWNWYQVGKSAIMFAESEARTGYNKDVVYRRWASLQGGVYVTPNEKTPPNPYLANFHGRDVVTTEGKHLTLVNPAYMTRQVHTLERENNGVRGHITSLAPLNTQNVADPWESKALQSFSTGIKEVISIDTLEGQPYLRLMSPLITERSCLICHAVQGYKEGDIRGGISISIPFSPYAVAMKQQRMLLVFVHFLICGVGLLGLWKGNDFLRSSEAILLMSEKRHRDILDTAMDGFLVIDTQGNLVEANQSYCQKTGYNEQELLTMSLSDLDAVQGVTQIASHIEKVIEHGEDRFESKHLCKNGNTFDIEIIAQHRTCIDGHIAVFLNDITERKQAQEAIKYSLSLLSASLESTADGILIVDMKGKIARWNRKFSEMWKIPIEVLSSLDDTRAINFILPQLANPEKFKDKVRQLYVHHNQSSFDLIEFADGRVFERYSQPQMIEDKVVGRVWSFRDVSERVWAEKALQESQERYQSILNSSPDNITMTDAAGKILMISPAGLAMFGYDREREVLGDFVANHLVPEDRERALSNLALKAQGGISGPDEYRGLRKDGSIFDIEVKSDFVRDDKGAPIKIIIVVRDITERKQAEEERANMQAQLQQAQKMEAIGQLAGGVAHDFNNMLGVILGYTEMALDHLDPEHLLYSDLEQVRMAASRSVEIVRQLLTFARKQTIAPKVLNLNEKVEGMLKMLHRLIGEDINIAWLPGENLKPVKVDPSQIDQILANLCVNARDAISGIGKMTIETGNSILDEEYCANHKGAIPGEYVWIAVSDNGCGINKELLPHIFEPFFTTKGVGQGTGLGLSMVYGAVKQNNGYVNVHSEPGQGTTFTIYLPWHKGDFDQAQIEEAGVPSAHVHETILLVEDEPSILKMTTTMLQRMGYTVLQSNTPGKAIELASEIAGEINLLMTDVIMPEMNGRDLEKRLASIKPGLKCLFMSGYTADVISHQGVIQEGVNFIQKPFSKKELAIKVRQVIES